MKRIIAVVLSTLMLAAPVLAQTTDPTASPSPPPSAPVTDWAAALAQANAQTAAYNAMKAAAEARSAMIAAEVTADRARLGSIEGQTAITGTTATGAGTSRAEAILLVSRSTRLAAADAARRLAPVLTAANERRPVLVLSNIGELSTTDAVQFDLQLSEIDGLLKAARARYTSAQAADRALPRASGGDRMATLTAIGAAVDLASTLGSYFLTDYSFASVDFTAPSQLTPAAVIEALHQAGVRGRFIIPSNLLASDVGIITTSLAPVEANYAALAGEAAAAKARATALRTVKGAEAVVQQYDQVDATATRALAAYDAFRTALVATVQDQGSMATRVIRQKKIQTLLSANPAPLILLITHSEAAALYTRKNLWTFLGGPPLHTMGGISMTYSLFDAGTGIVLESGVSTQHGGYRSVDQVEALFISE